MSRLIANMVVRNEESRYLVPVLERLKTQVDEIVVMDDYSDDNTPYIAAEMGCRVAQTDYPMFVENEGMLRQKAWKHLEAYANNGDWILAIDADEKLYGPVRTYLEQDQWDIIGIAFKHMWNETHYRIDKAWRPNISSRLFKFREGGVYAARKLACGSEPAYVQELIRMGRILWHTDLVMQHLGYVRDEDKKSKYDRYSELDGGAFHANAHINSIIDPNPTLLPWEHGQ